MLGYNSDVAASEVGAEILYAVGNILEGARVEDLELRVIDKEALLKEMTDG
jgi:citrate lyase gamma subunit